MLMPAKSQTPSLRPTMGASLGASGGSMMPFELKEPASAMIPDGDNVKRLASH